MKQNELFSAKFARPVVPGVLRRPRLFHLLDRRLEAPVLWVSGPPGSGKTALISSYVEENRPACLWYQLDQGDSDPGTFFHYLRRGTDPGRQAPAVPLPEFTPEVLAGLVPFAGRFFEALFATLPPDSVLVFDDYHELTESSPMHEVMRAGLTRPLPAQRVIFISRAAPPAVLLRLKANQHMALLGWNSLRLDFEECLALVEHKTGRTFSSAVMKRLYEVTGGWAAGLILFLQGLEGSDFEAEACERLPRQEIFDYFAAEIVDRLDHETRRFLYETSILPMMNETTAGFLTGVSRPDKVLTRLQGMNAFLNVYEGTPLHYSYHQLFREFLYARLIQETSSDWVRRLRVKAAEILEGEGRLDDAMALLKENHDWQTAARVLKINASSLFSEGRIQTLGHWLNQLPRTELEKDPWLLYWLGVCLSPYQPAEAKEVFLSSFQAFKACEDRTGALLSWSGLVDAHLYVFGTFHPMDEWLAEVEDLMEGDPQFPSTQVESKVMASMVTALALRNPLHPAFEDLLERCRELGEETLDGPSRLQSLLTLGFARLIQGRFSQVEELLGTMEAWVQAPEAPPLFKIMYRVLESYLFWKLARSARCMESSAQGLALAAESGIPVFRPFLRVHGAAAALTAGDMDTAEAILKDASREIDLGRSWEKAYFYAISTWAALLQDDIPRASEHSRLAVKHAAAAGEHEGLGVCHLGLALVEHTRGKPEKARETLEAGREAGAVEANPFIGFAYLLAEAEFALDGGREREAAQKLREALELAKPHGYINCYFWRPKTMARLFARALEEDIVPSYVRELIQRRDLLPEKPLSDFGDWPWPVKILTMGRFLVLVKGEPLVFSGKAPQRPIELLKGLIAMGGDASKEDLCDALWPDSPGDSAVSALTTTLQRLRRLLGRKDAVLVHQGRLALNPRVCWVDVEALQGIFNRLGSIWCAEPPDEVLHLSAELFQKAARLHSGPFLQGEGYDLPRALSLRHELQSAFSSWGLTLGSELEKHGQYDQALDLLTRARDIDPGREELYQRIMTCHILCGRKAQAVQEYHRCRRNLAELFACTPSDTTTAVYRKAGHASRA